MRHFLRFAILLCLFLLPGCIWRQAQAQQPGLQAEPAIRHLPLPSAANASPQPSLSGNSASQNTAPAGNSSGSLPAAYFYYSPYCGYCRLIEPLVNATEQKYAGKARIVRVDVHTQEGYAAFDQMARERNLSSSSRVVPLAVFGSRILVGYQEINQSLDSLLASING